LNQTYLGREQDALSRQVDEFVDLVDQAERAHFNAEESFGYGGGPSYQNLTSPVQQGAAMIQAPQDLISPMQPDISRFVSQRIR
jgi:diaminopimelate decarboxylase